MPSAGELAALRADASTPELMPDTCEILKVNQTHRSDGTQSTTSPKASGVRCRHSELSGRELMKAQKLSASVDCAVTLKLPLPDGVFVGTSDQLKITKQSGEVFTVKVQHVGDRSTQITLRVLGKNLAPKT